VWTAVRESSEATDLPREAVHPSVVREEVNDGQEEHGRQVKAIVEETGDKVKDVAEDTLEQVETHRVRSMLIVLLIAALTIGVWYFLSERD
jgi:uncharacterized protein HemX